MKACVAGETHTLHSNACACFHHTLAQRSGAIHVHCLHGSTFSTRKVFVRDHTER